MKDMEKNSYMYILATILLAFSTSCVSGQNNNAQNRETENTDTVNFTVSFRTAVGRKVKTFGNDSIQEFFRNSSALFSVEYIDPTSIIRQIFYYEDGGIRTIYYNDHPENLRCLERFGIDSSGLWMEGFFPSGNLRTQVFMVDTIIVTADNSIRGGILNIDYHENGQIRRIGFVGTVGTQNTPVGPQRYFGESGNLIKIRNHIFPKEGEPYIVEREYHENGMLRREKRYINFPDTDLKPTGTWKFYNEKGELTRIEVYEDGELVRTENIN